MITSILAFMAQSRILVAALIITPLISFGILSHLPHLGELVIDLMKQGYDAATITALLTAIGPDGRATYVWAGGIIDMLFPLAYVTLFAGLLYRFRLSEHLWWLALIPFALGLVDWAENTHIQMMLSSYPLLDPDLVARASMLTVTKWMLVDLIYVLLGVSFVFVIFRYFKAGKTDSNGIT